ncbi:hypothetical protein B7463_g11120, partial [Scytalidium lignicola]
MPRNLQPAVHPLGNVLVYDDSGRLLGGRLLLRAQNRYITWRMFYRYCRIAFILPPDDQQWGIFKLTNDGSTARSLRRQDHILQPGNYMILGPNQDPIQVEPTPGRVPRRVITNQGSSKASTKRDRLQTRFREGIRNRDQTCVITGDRFGSYDNPFSGLAACHIYPAARLQEWQQNGYRSWITDTTSSAQIGYSKLYSLQNGVLLSSSIHDDFDNFIIGIDPDDGYKIVCFGFDTRGYGNRRIQRSAIECANPNHRVSPDVLRWHFKMCVLKNLRVHAGTPQWDHDLGQDDMGEVLAQEDAGERMEAELFTRLGHLIA